MRKYYNKPEIFSQEKLIVNEAIAGCGIILVGWENPYTEIQDVTGAYPTAQAALSAHPYDWGWPIAPIFGVKDDKGAMAYFTDWSNAVYANQQSIIYGGKLNGLILRDQILRFPFHIRYMDLMAVVVFMSKLLRTVVMKTGGLSIQLIKNI